MKIENSNKISNINIILTFLIVLLHSNCLSYANNTSLNFTIFEKIQAFIQTICVIAVPTFFAMSAYLFFKNYDWKNYKFKIKKRIKSLLIPYLLWSIIFLLYMIVITNLPLFKSMNTSLGKIDYNFISIIKYIVFSKYNGQLWYVFDLLIMIFLSPIIFYVFSKKKYKIFGLAFIIINIIINFYFETDYYSFVYWLPLFLIFSYIAINKTRNIMDDYKIFISILFWAFFILSFCFYDNYVIIYLYRIICPFFIYILSNRISFLSKKPLKIYEISFFCYCVHFNIAVFFKRILIIFLGNNIYILFFLQFVVAILTILTVCFLYYTMKRFFPKILNVLSGGRS